MGVLELSGETWLEDGTRTCIEHRLVRAGSGRFKSKEVYPWIKTLLSIQSESHCYFSKDRISFFFFFFFKNRLF